MTFEGNTWRVSSYSGDVGDCIEVALASDHTGVRDTKQRSGAQLTVSTSAWKQFLVAVQSGQLDLDG